MSIENDIKQKVFRSPYQKLAINLVYTSNWLLYNQLEVFRAYDLTLQQYNVLRILRGQKATPIRVSDIADRMMDKSSNTSRLVDKLLLKQYAERTLCPNDRRAVDVVITDAGLKVLEAIDPAVIEWENSLDVITPEEAEQISRLLDKLRKSN
tara:strand:- start:499 stop:954 length:456 start_codon:yes stop_codon:yes gene_type:complete